MELTGPDRAKRLMDYGVGASSPDFFAMVVWTQQQRLQRNQFEYAAILAGAMNEDDPIPRIDGMDARFAYPLRWTIDAMLLLLPVTQGMAIARKLNGMIKDEVVGQRLRALDDVGDPLMFRDFFAHLDKYAVGSGDRPLREPTEGFRVQSTDEEDPRAELTLCFGGHRLPLHATSDAFIAICEALKEPWWAAVTVKQG